MDAAAVTLLHRLLREQSRSLLQYAAESYPWSKAQGHAACDAVRAMAADEADAVTRLARWLAKQRVPLPYTGAYPMHFTTANFVALSYLLPRLAQDERQRLADAERTCAALPEGEGRNLLQGLIDLMKRNVAELQALQTTTTPPALAS